MVTQHIKELKRSPQGLWTIELWNGQLVTGTSNLAESINRLSEYVWPMPVMSATVKVEMLPKELEAA